MKLVKTIVMMVSILIILFLMANIPVREAVDLDSYIESKYENLLAEEGVKPAYDLFKRGMIGYLNLKADGQTIKNDKLTLIDFRLSSRKKRMWIIDLKADKVLYYRLVAHGKNTGDEFAKKFSNTKNSNQSSLGFYLTGENYIGKHGLSLRLDGMEPGFNSQARARAIVMHGANYVSNDFIKLYGRLGRSFGCPAIAVNKHKEIIKLLSNSSVLFIYAANEEYLQKTKLNNRLKAEEFLRSNQNLAKSAEASL